MNPAEFRKQLDAVAKKMSSLRPEKPFSDMEKALGLWAFSNWLFLGEQAETSGDASGHFDYPNISARFAALAFVDNKLDEPALFNAIRQEFLSFDVEQETEWGFQKANHSEWLACLTRSTILLCRGLAYRYTEDEFSYLRHAKWNEVRDVAIAMFNESVGIV